MQYSALLLLLCYSADARMMMHDDAHCMMTDAMMHSDACTMMLAVLLHDAHDAVQG